MMVRCKYSHIHSVLVFHTIFCATPFVVAEKEKITLEVHAVVLTCIFRRKAKRLRNTHNETIYITLSKYL